MTLAKGKVSKPTKRQRKAQIFEQGVNPAPPTPPPTVPRPQRSCEPARQCDHNTPSRLFEPPKASQLATNVHAANILGEDEDEELEVDGTADDEEPIEPAEEETMGAVSESPVEYHVGCSPARAETIDEEPHLHWRYRACWGTMEKNAIASAFAFKRRKPLYTVSENNVWGWADGIVEMQLPRTSKIESLTATLYYTNGSHQAKADRCTIALQRSRRVARERVVIGNWTNFEEELAEMDKESAQIMTCDFDLVLKEELPALQTASQPTRGAARQ